ncbi:MAG: glycerol-3-phosphate acyltransferase [Actinobacteria bacterium]|nr:glycerol-3-phosphate acyltransferase [Cyanobacteriota bacterium]MCL5772462.1 glycerol-3-phosphate acyltransferase [Actinomycetota bacterium]
MILFEDLIIIICSYLIGAIPFSYIIGIVVSGKKLTEIGDRNPGGWNLIFNVSKTWGILGTLLDFGKGYLIYFFVYKFLNPGNFLFFGATHNQLIAMLSGVAVVAGHNYSPYLKFGGGKGLASFFGFLIALNPYNLFFIAIGMLLGLLWAKNMIWSVTMGIIFPGVFLYFYIGSVIYLLMIILLILVMIPKQINRSLKMSTNFKFRKEKTIKDLFTPKIR